MKPLVIISTILFIGLLSHSRESLEITPSSRDRFLKSEKTIFYQLANTTIPIKIQWYGDRSDIVYINLHDDETTSVEATKRVLEEYGGILIELENKSQRNIHFRLAGHLYKVDPNTIFSKEGIKKSLEQLGRSSAKAIEESAKLGERILELIPAKTKYIVALHNNTPGHFSANDYASKNKRSADSKKIYINSAEDPDDFFLTTDKLLYESIADRGYNTILQDNKNCADDGSLSVYCGKKNIRYVNCETEHGKVEKYYEMVRQLALIIQRNIDGS